MQIFLKKNQHRPYTASSWSITGVPVLTFAERPNEFMTNATLPKTTKEDLQLLDVNLFPHPHLLSWPAFKSWTTDKLLAGLVPAEYIGRHGVCGLSWAPLEYYDDNHKHLLGLEWFKHRCENIEEYLLEGELMDVDEDEDDEAVYEDGAVQGIAANKNVFGEALQEIEAGNGSEDEHVDGESDDSINAGDNRPEDEDPVVERALADAEQSITVESALADAEQSVTVESALADAEQAVTPGATIVGREPESGGCSHLRLPPAYHAHPTLCVLL